jgi:N-acetylneuraminic acid mutarotase
VSQQALPQGATRRRAAFGLFDADGWTWAGLKAAFWFLFIIFMLGVVPNWAYYFTTGTTLQVGYNFASVINLCPADNEDLPCPAPAGAMKPWQPSPPELALPTPRAGSSVYQSGSTVYLIGGAVEGTATDEVLVSEVTENGNLVPWTTGPALPEPRTDAAVGLYGGIPYLIGGYDASGQPTATVYQGVVEEGVLTGWELSDGENRTAPLTLPQPLAGAGVANGTAGFMLVGGYDVDGQPTNGAYLAWIDDRGDLGSWTPLEGLALPEPRADVIAEVIADFLYVVGGEGPDGAATDTVFRLEIVGDEPATNEAGALLGWAVAPEDQALPAPRTDATAFNANGAIYAIGGIDAEGVPQDSMLWMVPDTTTGDFDGWQRLDQTDLPVATASAPLVGVGPHAFIFGGQTPDGTTDGSLRAEISPRPPFFQLGIAGATIPALAIEGEIGQQLGYLNAMGVGTVNFVILIILGVAFSRPESSKRVIGRLLRIKPDEEERYRA